MKMRVWRRMMGLVGLCLVVGVAVIGGARWRKAAKPMVTFVHAEYWGDQAVVMVTPDGAGRRELSGQIRLFWKELVWSPNGQYLIGAGQDGSGSPIAVLIDPSNHRPWVQLATYASPTPKWSPNSRRMVGYFYLNDGFGHFVLNLDGSIAVQIPDSSAGSSAFDWSPDGTRIALSQSRHLDIVRADGSGRRRLVTGESNGDGWINEVLWSPDGDSIAYVTTRGQNPFGVICVVQVLNAAKTCKAVEDNDSLTHLMWSEEKHSLIRTLCHFKCRAVSIIEWDVQHNTENVLLEGAFDHAAPFLSPDGKYIVYSSGRQGSRFFDVYVQDTGGSTGRKVVTAEEIAVPLAWRPAIDRAWSPSKMALGGGLLVLIGGGRLPLRRRVS